MRGIVFEGGGAKGAYHIGVVRAYIERGYEFDGFVGTSIGAVNAAALAQGDFEKALEIWSSLDFQSLFDAESRALIELMGRRVGGLAGVHTALKHAIAAGGIDTSSVKMFISSIVDEQKLRHTAKDFGLVTVSINERKPYELFLEDIPQGELVNYIMASASLPGLRPQVIGENKFIDGAFHDNCPINMLLKKGYDEIVVVRTMAKGRFRRFDKDAARITVIKPQIRLGPTMLFSREQLDMNLRHGYMDGLRTLKPSLV